MPDIAKVISANAVKNGGAFTCNPSSSVSALSSLASVNYGAAPDIDAQNAVVARHGKFKNYYQSDTQYSADSSIDTATGTAGADTQILYSADAYGSHVINGVSWSYSGLPTSGNLAVEVPSGTAIFSTYITGSGQGIMTFPDPIRGSGNNSMNVRLSAGGLAVVGKLNVFGHRVE